MNHSFITLKVNREMDPRLDAHRHSQNQRLCWLRHSGAFCLSIGKSISIRSEGVMS